MSSTVKFFFYKWHIKNLICLFDARSVFSQSANPKFLRAPDVDGAAGPVTSYRVW